MGMKCRSPTPRRRSDSRQGMGMVSAWYWAYSVVIDGFESFFCSNPSWESPVINPKRRWHKRWCPHPKLILLLNQVLQGGNPPTNQRFLILLQWVPLQFCETNRVSNCMAAVRNPTLAFGSPKKHHWLVALLRSRMNEFFYAGGTPCRRFPQPLGMLSLVYSWINKALSSEVHVQAAKMVDWWYNKKI